MNDGDLKKGVVLWFTGLSSAGKTTLADRVFKCLKERGIKCERLDGDIVRKDLCKDLGFSKKDRDRNIERVVFVAKTLSKQGIVVLASFISPYRKHRLHAREEIEAFIEIFVNPPLEVCEKRDVKGLYSKARRGEIENFTGISDPYEIPENPEIELRTDKFSKKECVRKILEYLETTNFL